MRRFFDWFLRDRRSGAIVIAQWPNAPLWLFAAAAGSAWMLEAALPGLSPPILVGLRAVALVSLAVWALDEVARGVNPWRRCLGAAVLIGLCVSLLARP